MHLDGSHLFGDVLARALYQPLAQVGGELRPGIGGDVDACLLYTSFAEKHELDRFFLYGFGSHHFYLHQRYTSDPEMVMKNRILSVHF